MKEYIQNKLKSIFYLSPTEVMQAKFSITLKTLLSIQGNECLWCGHVI